MAVYARSEDLVRIGAYKPGADPDLDRALRAEARQALAARFPADPTTWIAPPSADNAPEGE